MKRLLASLLTITIMFTFCFSCDSFAEEHNFGGMNDANLREYIADTLYDTLLDGLDSDQYAVTNVQTVYISQEYIDELEYNSQMNVYFGYSLSDLDSQFEGTRYVFTLGDDGQTTVKAFENYDDTYNQVIRNVAIGTGVIVVCVTVSAVTAGAGAPAVSMIFAVAAKTGTTCALSGAALGGISSGIINGIQTGDMDQALKAAAVGASEGFKWGAITGAISGAATEGIGLYRATLAPDSTLTMNDVALIQKESKLPLSFIKYMHSMEEYNLYKEFGLKAVNINGTLAYVQPETIDFSLTDQFGRTNRDLIKNGLSPVDKYGAPYELHHVGQNPDSPLAILTQAQHRGKGHFSTLHYNTGSSESEIEREVFEKAKDVFWMEYLKMFGGT